MKNERSRDFLLNNSIKKLRLQCEVLRQTSSGLERWSAELHISVIHFQHLHKYWCSRFQSNYGRCPDLKLIFLDTPKNLQKRKCLTTLTANVVLEESFMMLFSTNAYALMIRHNLNIDYILQLSNVSSVYRIRLNCAR